MAQILECVMLVCFGISWPISVYKSYKTRSTKGKSLIFMIAIILGYIAGITSKFISGNLNYVVGLYIFNVLVVCLDLTLFLINKHRETAFKRAKDNLKHLHHA